MFFPFEAIAGFLLRPVFRALEEWSERVRQSQPLEPSTARLIRERAAQETSQWANSHAIAFAVVVAPLTGAIATFGAVVAVDLPVGAQIFAGALGGVLGLLLSVVGIALSFLFMAIPTVREERRAAQMHTREALEEMDARLARPPAAKAALEAHEERLSTLLFWAENARKYPKPHGLAEPINEEFDAIRRTLDEYRLTADLKAFQSNASDDMDWNELRDIVASGQAELAKTSFCIRQVLPMLSP